MAQHADDPPVDLASSSDDDMQLDDASDEDQLDHEGDPPGLAPGSDLDDMPPLPDAPDSEEDEVWSEDEPAEAQAPGPPLHNPGVARAVNAMVAARERLAVQRARDRMAAQRAEDDANFPGFFEAVDDDDDDSSDEEAAQAPQPGAGGVAEAGRRRAVPLHQLLRLVAGGGLLGERPVLDSHDRLLDSLRQQGVLHTDKIYEAMRTCPRDSFVMGQYRREALIDAPIRVAEHGFNISAPHMHACCLEALQLAPGHRFLDVGSGCGVLTACGAMLVGRTGSAVGIDVRQAAVDMADASVRRLAAASAPFSAKAAPIRFELHNVFMPAKDHQGQYDRIHVGASCPPELLGRLTGLLGPNGGAIVAPVAPSDLRLITVSAAGVVTQRVLSQVRYGELEIPGDAEIVLETLAKERAKPAQLPPSSFAEDVAAIHGTTAAAAGPITATPAKPRKSLSGVPSSPVCALETPFGSSGSDVSSALSRRWSLERPSPQGTPSAGLASGSSGSWGRSRSGGGGGGRGSPWPRRVVDFFTSCSDPRPHGEEELAGRRQSDSSGDSEPGTPAALNAACLGPPDCLLMGPSWSLPVHRSVLCARSELLRARCGSGMRDAAAAQVAVPEHFGQAAMEVFAQYLYQDTIDMDMEPAAAAGALQVGLYYGAPRLVALCEVVLSTTLTDDSVSFQDKTEAAPGLLAVADEAGLPQLRAIALDWLVHNYAAASGTAAYQALSKQQSDMVAAAACALLQRCHALLQHLASQDSLPEPKEA